MTFPEILKRIRNEIHYTQEQLARELNVSFSTINRWEKGHTVPSVLAKMRLRDFCKAHLKDIEIINELEK